MIMSSTDLQDTDELNHVDDSNFVANLLIPIEPVFLVTTQTSKDTLVVISDMTLACENTTLQTVYDLAQHTWIYDTNISLSYGDTAGSIDTDKNENYIESNINFEPYIEIDNETFDNSLNYDYYYLELRETNPYYDGEMDIYLMNDWSYSTNEYSDDLMYVSSSIKQLTSEEDRAISKTLQVANKCTLTENFTIELSRLHQYMCMQHEIACPFWNTQCRWFDTVPKITSHIRLMHNSRVVNKKNAAYVVNMSMLEALEQGYKLAQMHDNRIFLISIADDCTYVYVTVHVTCECPRNHSQICWTYLTAHVPERQCSVSWRGLASPLCVSPARLQDGYCLTLPKPTTSFTLTVQLGCN